jgi:hypothetical protein
MSGSSAHCEYQSEHEKMIRRQAAVLEEALKNAKSSRASREFSRLFPTRASARGKAEDTTQVSICD